MAKVYLQKPYGGHKEGATIECGKRMAHKLCDQPPFFGVLLDEVSTSYRGLQNQAKNLGIAANQSRESLKEAIEAEIG